MFLRVLASRSNRILLSGSKLISSSGTRCWSVLSSATTRKVSQKPLMSVSCACSKICACGAHKITKGDQNLIGFLRDEIKFEKDSIKTAPSLKSFSAKKDGTIVTLEKETNGERVAIIFDVNQNINEDEAYISGDESDNDNPPGAHEGEGKTLRFFCEYNQGVLSKPDNELDEDDELFQVVNVAVMPSPDAADSKGLYSAETENLDPNLYEMLVDMLAERGVDSDFAQQLLEYSTALEHHYYINFLEDLQNFVKQ